MKRTIEVSSVVNHGKSGMVRNSCPKCKGFLKMLVKDHFLPVGTLVHTTYELYCPTCEEMPLGIRMVTDLPRTQEEAVERYTKRKV